MSDRNDGLHDSSTSSTPKLIFASTDFQLSFESCETSALTVGGIGQRVESPATVTRLGRAPVRSTRAKAPPRSNSMPNVAAMRASLRKIESLSHFEPSRKWITSTRLDFPAPFRVCLSVAPGLLGKQDVEPLLEREVLERG
jgi:hypothetical protein